MWTTPVWHPLRHRPPRRSSACRPICPIPRSSGTFKIGENQVDRALAIKRFLLEVKGLRFIFEDDSARPGSGQNLVEQVPHGLSNLRVVKIVVLIINPATARHMNGNDSLEWDRGKKARNRIAP